MSRFVLVLVLERAAASVPSSFFPHNTHRRQHSPSLLYTSNMPPIPIYSNSPINAAKGDAVSPPTPDKTQNNSASKTIYPPAQPGASPAVPAPTQVARPTPTQPLADHEGPPPPQPGAVPAPTTAPPPYPPQMNIPPPTGTSAGATPQSVQRGTSTTFPGGGAFVPGPSPLEHPPGYQQDVHADALNRYQRAAQDALEEEESRSRRTSSVTAGLMGGDGEDGVWSGAKKMMAAAGEKLAAAEGEMWKRINKE